MKKFLSDNGRNFVRADRAMRSAFNKLCKTDLPKWASVQFFDWEFLSPYSPWKGGIWERLISITKSVLCAILKGSSSFSDEMLRSKVEH